nr:MAG TPA: hypothetical protein [Bacteriophage sp.]
MTNKQIKHILDLHSVPNYEKSAHIYADSMLSGTDVFDQVIDLTGISKKSLYEWLGY